MKSAFTFRKVAKITALVIFVLAAVVFGVRFLINKSAVNTYNNSISQAPFDAIIIPGLPYDSCNISVLLKARMLWAKSLYEKGISKNIIFSGSSVHTPYVEAQVMKIFADSLGIPQANTYIEDKALHSTENVDYGIALARKLGFEKVAIATDPFQYLFLSRHIYSNNIKVAMLPFSIDSMSVYSKSKLPEIDVQAAFVSNFIPLKDRH